MEGMILQRMPSEVAPQAIGMGHGFAINHRSLTYEAGAYDCSL